MSTRAMKSLARRPTSPRIFFAKILESKKSTEASDAGEFKVKPEVKKPCIFRKSEESEQVYEADRVLDIAQLEVRRSENSSIRAPEISVLQHDRYLQPFDFNRHMMKILPSFPPAFHDFQPHLSSIEHPLPGYLAFLDRRRRKADRPRRQRTTFSSEQIRKLELEYLRGVYITRGRRSQLAGSLMLTETQIKIWFQNRRAKEKRIEKAQIDQRLRDFIPWRTPGYKGYCPRSNVTTDIAGLKMSEIRSPGINRGHFPMSISSIVNPSSRSDSSSAEYFQRSDSTSSTSNGIHRLKLIST